MHRARVPTSSRGWGSAPKSCSAASIGGAATGIPSSLRASPAVCSPRRNSGWKWRGARGGRASVATVFFITHPDVAIDPAVAIPDWPLNSRGRERMRAIMGWSWARSVRRVFASSERKARDAAEILAAGLGLTGYGIVAALGEADRSATGYLPRQEFEETADAFFAHPQQSVRVRSRQ